MDIIRWQSSNTDESLSQYKASVYLNDALHEVFLSQWVSAIHNLLQHSRKNNLRRETKDINKAVAWTVCVWTRQMQQIFGEV